MFKVQINNGTIKSVSSPKGASLNSETGEVTYTTTGTELNLEFEVTGISESNESTRKLKISLDNYYGHVVKANSLLKAIEQNTFENDSTTNILVNNTVYKAHIYNYEDDLIINENTEYGSQSDVATSSEYATNMVVLKVNGNLIINEGKKLTTVASTTGYGGPKGFLIYVTGDIIKNGTISMTAREAKAEGNANCGSPGGGASQISGGSSDHTNERTAVLASFGQGASGVTKGSGGGGYYGGGESSYIGNEGLKDKHMTCYNCSTSDEESTKTQTTTNVSSDAIADYAKSGAGYVRITYLVK